MYKMIVEPYGSEPITEAANVTDFYPFGASAILVTFSDGTYMVRNISKLRSVLFEKMED